MSRERTNAITYMNTRYYNVETFPERAAVQALEDCTSPLYQTLRKAPNLFRQDQLEYMVQCFENNNIPMPHDVNLLLSKAINEHNDRDDFDICEKLLANDSHEAQKYVERAQAHKSTIYPEQVGLHCHWLHTVSESEKHPKALRDSAFLLSSDLKDQLHKQKPKVTSFLAHSLFKQNNKAGAAGANNDDQYSRGFENSFQ